MRDRPFTKLLLAVGIFVIVSLVFSYFRHGFYLTDLFGVLLCTIVSVACLDRLVWPHRSDRPAFYRAGLFLDFIIVLLLTAWALFTTFVIPKPTWLFVGFFIFCICKLFYLWLEHRHEAHRDETMDPLQRRLIEKNHDNVA